MNRSSAILFESNNLVSARNNMMRILKGEKQHLFIKGYHSYGKTTILRYLYSYITNYPKIIQYGCKPSKREIVVLDLIRDINIYIPENTHFFIFLDEIDGKKVKSHLLKLMKHRYCHIIAVTNGPLQFFDDKIINMQLSPLHNNEYDQFALFIIQKLFSIYSDKSNYNNVINAILNRNNIDELKMHHLSIGQFGRLWLIFSQKVLNNEIQPNYKAYKKKIEKIEKSIDDRILSIGTTTKTSLRVIDLQKKVVITKKFLFYTSKDTSNRNEIFSDPLNNIIHSCPLQHLDRRRIL